MRNRYWLVFALILVWKVLLFAFVAQPVPANDAFFYDGAVIHHLLHGGFYNPCVALAFPVSGTQVFSAYPPLYQAPLLAWMSIFDVSALSAMGLHLCLFVLYMGVLLLIFRRIQIPAWCVNLSGFFLATMTFHDRPDSFAHLLGVLAVYAAVRSRDDLITFKTSGDAKWLWLAVILIVLTFCASLQIGGIYLLVVSIIIAGATLLNNLPFPLFPLLLMAIAPAVLAFLIKEMMPIAWSGFIENVHQTPFLTGLRNPGAAGLMKIVRAVPGIFLVTAFLIYGWFSGRLKFSRPTGKPAGILLFAALLPALGIVFASLLIISSNTVAISNYLQPVIVASYLALLGALQVEKRWMRFQIICLIPAIVLGSIRFVGMSTWGLACAHDVSYSQSVKMIDAEVSGHEAGYKVVMSSAFLYAAAPHKELDLIHSDWMAVANGDSRDSDSKALLTLKPTKIILTQFDYYRRYKEVLARVQNDPTLKRIEVINTAHVMTPDSINSLQRVIQHISWAPVIINLSWKN